MTEPLFEERGLLWWSSTPVPPDSCAPEEAVGGALTIASNDEACIIVDNLGLNVFGQRQRDPRPLSYSLDPSSFPLLGEYENDEEEADYQRAISNPHS